jgi:hypothetical protein
MNSYNDDIVARSIRAGISEQQMRREAMLAISILALLCAILPITGGQLVFQAPDATQPSQARNSVVFEGMRGALLDCDGDSLPASALMRLGTIRSQGGLNSGHTDRVMAAVFLKKGRLIATTGYDNTIRIWSTESGKETQRLEHALASGWALAVSPRSGLIASGAGMIGLWDTQKCTLLRDWQVPHPVICGLAFSPDEKLLASVTTQEIVDIWEVATAKHVRELPQQERNLLPVPVTFSPDGLTVASAGTDGKIRAWDIANGKQSLEVAAHNRRILALSYSPEGNVLASGSVDGFVRMWDVKTGNRGKSIEPHNGSINCIAYSNDGRMIAVGTSENTVSLWEVATGYLRRTFIGHQAPVNCVAFSPTGTVLASGSDDHTALIWNLRAPAAKTQAKTIASESNLALKKLWENLGDPEGAKPYEAMLQLLAASENFVPFAKERLTQAPRVNSQQMGRLIRNLDSRDFEERRQALKELEEMDYIAESALRKALRSNPSAEMRGNVKHLLEKLNVAKSAEQLRKFRAIEVLEYIGDSSALSLLTELAKGDPDALLTKEAKSSLGRLQKKNAQTN